MRRIPTAHQKRSKVQGLERMALRFRQDPTMQPRQRIGALLAQVNRNHRHQHSGTFIGVAPEPRHLGKTALEPLPRLACMEGFEVLDVATRHDRQIVGRLTGRSNRPGPRLLE